MLPARYVQGRMATVAVNEFIFKQPVRVGDILSFYAKMERIGRTSMTGVYAAGDLAHTAATPMPLSSVLVAAAAGLLLGLMATVEPPRTYYRWMVVLLTGVAMATVYTASGAVHRQHAIAPLVVVLVAAIAISVGIGLVGSDRALRSVNQRTPLTPTPRWQDHR